MPNQDTNNTLNKNQFEQLFKQHFVHLCNFARQYVGDTDAAKEITQKVFIKLWENREKVKLQKSITSYLFTAVKSRCLNYIRDHKKYRSQILDLDNAAFDSALVEDHLGLEELKDRIAKALSTLPEKCRLVFEMSRYQEMKYKEIAEELNISQKTVEAHMSKALKSLRENLEDYVSLILVLLGWLSF